MLTRKTRIAAVLGTALLALTACGGNTEADSRTDTTPSTTATSAPATKSATKGMTVVKVTFSGKTVTPQGKRISVELKKPVSFQIDADAPGEIHVHSTPEQHIEYPKGKSTTNLTFTKPGVIDVESHSLDKLIVQLEVK